MTKKLLIFLCLLLVGFAGSVSATTINFNDANGSGIYVDDFYSTLGVSFSNTIFRDLNSLAIGVSGDFGIVGAGGPTIISFGINNAIVIDFSIAISSVSIDGIDVGANGMQMEAYDSNNQLLASTSFYGQGDGYDYDQGVTTYNNLTIESEGSSIAKILLYQPSLGTMVDGQTFPEGMVFDNLTFKEIAPVPEPATMLLFVTGLAGLVGLRLRRKNK